MGYCRRVDATGAEIDFYSLPDGRPRSERVPLEDLRTPSSYTGLRAWFPLKGFGHTSGLVEAWDGAQFRVRVGHATLNVTSQQFVFLNQSTPTRVAEALAQGAVGSPGTYFARNPLRSSLLEQTAFCLSYDAVMASSVSLYPHQLETMQRVMEDPVSRYLLADEVGLGKTIEAGLVISQTLRDDSTALVYVACPEPLLGQWRNELGEKFGLERFIEGDDVLQPRIFLRSHNELLRRGVNLEHCAYLVVDEAHQAVTAALAGGFWPDLSDACGGVDGLLLLSATPMRGDYSVLEALLHLVDSSAYPLGQQDRFVARIEKRSDQLMIVETLTSTFASDADRQEALRRIVSDYPDDPHIRRLSRQLSREHGGTVSAGYADLADYIRETYRVSRRMIRHRRGVGEASAFPTAGRSPVILDCDSHAGALIDAFIDEYRALLMAEAAQDGERFWQALNAGLAGIPQLRAWIGQRLDQLDDEELSDSTEAEYLKGHSVRLRHAAEKDRVWAAALAFVKKRVNARQRIVAISEYSDTARRFALAMGEHLGPAGVLTHFMETSTDSRERSTEYFRAAPSGALLVGDRSLEEGKNLQGAHVLLNLDVPLSINRVEQRVGRVDRYSGGSTFPTVSQRPEVVILRRTDSEWSVAHARLLDDGAGVLSESVSTAQRLLANFEERLRADVFRHGRKSLEVDVEALRAEIDEERREIDELEAWESDISGVNSYAALWEGIAEYESRVKDLQWAIDVASSPAGSLPLVRVVSRAGQAFRFARPTRPMGRPAIPAIPSLENWLTTDYTVSRSESVELTGSAPFRVGSDFVDWLANYLASDLVGRTWAVCVTDRARTYWDAWFRFDLLVDFDDGHLADFGIDAQRIGRRARRLFSPRLVTVWCDGGRVASLQEQGRFESVLQRESNRDADVPWPTVVSHLPDWSQEVLSAERVAMDYARTASAVNLSQQLALDSADKEAERRASVLRARQQRAAGELEFAALSREIETEDAVAVRIRSGLQDPRISVVSCGALIRRPS